MLEDRDVRALCAAIVAQAIDDYTGLRARGAERATENRLTYTIREIEDFFRSEYGESVIHQGLGFPMLDGNDFLRAARRGIRSNLSALV